MTGKSAPRRTGLIQKKVFIQASPSIVFLALTEAKDLAHWFCDRANSKPVVGGELRAFWRTGKSGESGRAVFTKIVRDSLVEIDWVDDVPAKTERKAKHLLRYEIRPLRGSTEVSMSDEGSCPPDEETLAALDEGWNLVLLELKDFCEHRERTSRRKTASLSVQSA